MANSNDCVVCYDPILPTEEPLPCNHSVHRECIQKSADALQELRAQDGYSPLEQCTCPVCRTPVPGMVPKPPPETPNLGYQQFLLDQEDLERALREYHESNSETPPFGWYIWTILSEKYPDQSPDILIAVAEMYETLYLMSARHSLLIPDTRFETALNKVW